MSYLIIIFITAFLTRKITKIEMTLRMRWNAELMKSMLNEVVILERRKKNDTRSRRNARCREDSFYAEGDVEDGEEMAFEG